MSKPNSTEVLIDIRMDDARKARMNELSKFGLRASPGEARGTIVFSARDTDKLIRLLKQSACYRQRD